MAWRAFDALTDSAYYEIASPGGSRGTVDVGNVHLAAWVTIRPTVTSKTRRIVGTEGNSGTSPYGLTLLTTGTNGTLSARIRGVNPGGLVLTASVALTSTQLNRPLYVVAVVGGGLLDLYVDGVLADSRTIPGTGYFAVSTAPLTLGRRPEVTGDSVTGEVSIHGVSSGNTTPSGTAIAAAYAAGLVAEDVVGIASSTDHLWSPKQDMGANSTLLDRVGTDHLVRTGLPVFYEEWAALDELSDTNYYETATGGNRGTQNDGETYAQAWITIESAGSSKTRRIYSTEGSTSSTPWGITLMTTGTNDTLVLRSRGPTGVVSEYYTVQAGDYGRRMHVLGVIGSGVMALYVDGALVGTRVVPAVGYFDVSTTPIAIGRRPTGTGTTGDAVDGTIKVHGVSTGDYGITQADVTQAFTDGRIAQDIVGVTGKTDHLWSPRQDGSAGASLVDRVGTDDMTLGGVVSYVTARIEVTAAGVIDPTTGAATLAQAAGSTIAGSFDLAASAVVNVGVNAAIAASMPGLEATGLAFASENPLLVYAQRGTTYTTDLGEVIPDSGRTIAYTQDIRRKLMLGYIRTDNANAYPVIDAQVVAMNVDASLPGFTAVAAASVGNNVAIGANLAGFVASAVLTNPTEGMTVAATMPGMTAAASVTVGGAGVFTPFGVGSHWNERTKYAQLKAAGVDTIRVDVAWYHVEAVQGTYAWTAIDEAMEEAQAQGLIVHCVLGYTAPWASSSGTDNKYAPLEIYEPQQAAYFQAVMARYGSYVGTWEIWNEPDHVNFLKLGTGCWARNNHGGQTDVVQKRLQLRHIQEIALSQPAAAGKVFTSPGLAEGGSHDSGMRAYLATIPSWSSYAIGNFHTYGYPSYQRLIDSPANWRATGNSTGKGGSWPLWITEHGIVPVSGVSTTQAKTFLIRSYAVALAQPQVQKLFWFRAGYDPDHYDLFDASSNTTAAYAAYAALTSKWTGCTSFTAWSSGNARGTIATRAGANRMAIIWADSGGAAISSYSFGGSIVTVWNQDGATISSGTTLTAAPVFVELNP